MLEAYRDLYELLDWWIRGQELKYGPSFASATAGLAVIAALNAWALVLLGCRLTGARLHFPFATIATIFAVSGAAHWIAFKRGNQTPSGH